VDKSLQVEATLREEVRGVKFGDSRLDARYIAAFGALARDPGESLPTIYRNPSALKAVYRLFSNPRVSFDQCLNPHIQATRDRSLTAYDGTDDLLVAHDTTEIAYQGESPRNGLGDIAGVGQGFFLHASLALTFSARRPLGVIHAETYVRDPDRPRPPRKFRSNGKRRKAGTMRYADPTKETARWLKSALATEDTLRGVKPVHLFDRESDAYDLLATLEDGKSRFIARVRNERVVEAADKDLGELSVRGKLSEVLAQRPLLCTRSVNVSRRTRKKGSISVKAKPIHAPRKERIAHLEIRAGRVRLFRPKGWPKTLSKSIELNCVLVQEVMPPEGEEPVEWLLYTTEPIDTAAQVERIVDGYCRRWLVEEFFKALKTGCGIEKRQLESYHALRNYLAMTIPIAWSLLLLRDTATNTPDAPAEAVLSPDQVELFRVVKPYGITLPAAATAKDAMNAVAALGGHLKQNGRPGWIVLGRGYQQLLAMELVWQGAKRAFKKDVSNS
jgi:hypothetical protein